MNKTYKTPPYLINGQHRTTILLIGVGGTGSLILSRLARLHMCLNQLGHPGLHVTAYDNDTVERHNIGRQLFTASDLDRNKAITAISKINRAFGLDWTAVAKHYEFENKKDSFANIFITAVDTLMARKQMSSLRKKAIQSEERDRFNDINTPFLWLDCGNVRDRGQCIVSTILEDNGVSLPDLFELYGDVDAYDTEEQQGASCSYAESLEEQDLFINDSIAVFASDIIWKLFKDKQLKHQGCFINMDGFTTTPISIN